MITAPSLIRKLACTMCSSALVLSLASCGSSTAKLDDKNEMIVSVRDQSMLLVNEGRATKIYPISTSKFGLGSQPGSNRTPLGRLEIAQKIGGSAPKGAVFKGRRPTGEVLKPNAPGRDPIVTRIMWLRGKDASNANTFRRLIYIHGTPEENTIGEARSYGCIRMKSSDVMDLYRRVGVGADVKIIRGSLDRTPEGRKYYARNGRLPHARGASSRGVSLRFN